MEVGEVELSAENMLAQKVGQCLRQVRATRRRLETDTFVHDTDVRDTLITTSVLVWVRTLSVR